MSEAPFARLLFSTRKRGHFFPPCCHPPPPHTTLYNSSEHKSRLILVTSALLLVPIFSCPLRFVSCAFFVSWLSPLFPLERCINTLTPLTQKSYQHSVVNLLIVYFYLCVVFPDSLCPCLLEVPLDLVRASWLKSPPQMCRYICLSFRHLCSLFRSSLVHNPCIQNTIILPHPCLSFAGCGNRRSMGQFGLHSISGSVSAFQIQAPLHHGPLPPLPDLLAVIPAKFLACVVSSIKRSCAIGCG